MAPKSNNSLCLPFCLGESCPPAFALMSDTSVPPHTPLVPFKSLPLCWNLERVSLHKSMCGFFERKCLRIQHFLPLTQSPLVFAARSYGDLSSCHWNPGLRGLVWGWETLLLRYLSWMFIYHMWVWDQPILCLRLYYLSGWMWFNSTVVRLPFSLISDGSDWWLLYSLVVILMWLCKEVGHVYLCLHLTGRRKDYSWDSL